jgi:hypothetical protein
MIYRTYIDKDTTIINKSFINTGLNPVLEIAFGSYENTFNNTSTSTKVYTRHLFHIDIDKLKNKILNEKIDLDNIKSHKLFMFNTISFVKDLYGCEMIDSSKRAFDVTLKVYRVNQFWIEGNGYDFVYRNTLFSSDVKNVASNWFYSDTNNSLWDVEGVLDDNLLLVGQQYFEYGYENLQIDFTDEINYFLNNVNDINYGYLLVLENDDTRELPDQINKISFFTRHTQTYLRPFLQTEFDLQVSDDRAVFNSDNNTLCIKSRKEINNLKITDYCNQVIYQTEDIIKKPDNIYCANLENFNFDTNTMYYDNWYFDNELIKEESFINNEETNFTDSNLFSIVVENFNNEERLSTNIKRKIFLNVKKYNRDNLLNKYNIFVSLYVKQTNIENIVIYENIEVNYFDNKYYFILDTEWLLEQQYIIKFHLENQDKQIISVKEMLFFIV